MLPFLASSHVSCTHHLLIAVFSPSRPYPSTMISSTSWVPRGFALEFPEKYELDDAEMERITQLGAMELEDAKEDLEEAQAANPESLVPQETADDDLKAYDLENYDNEDAGEGVEALMFPGLAGTDAQYHEDGEDAYLTLPTQEDEDEEKEENQIYPTDNLVLATRTEDDISYLDVYIYDDGAGAPQGADEEAADANEVAPGMVRGANLYVHHDIMLPLFPLCVEWVNFRPGKAVVEDGDANIGNFAAVGTMDPQIEVWNLDCLDKAFPDVILGSTDGSGPKKKKKKGKSHVVTHHTDAVLSLAHNRTHRLVLALTLADHTVKLWDLNLATAVRLMVEVHHGTTVASSQWHLLEAQILLTGGYDSQCALSDVRIADDKLMLKHYKIGGGEEVENVRWGLAERFYAGTDAGNVYCFDARADKPVWTLHAHDLGISLLDTNPFIDGMVITAAMGDKLVKLWNAALGAPLMVILRDFGVGNVLAALFAPDIEVAGCAVVGGVLGAPKLWDVLANRGVRQTFSEQVGAVQQRARAEAEQAGKLSRIARKYVGDAEETIAVEGGADLDDSEDEADMEE